MNYIESALQQAEILRAKDNVRILALETSCDETAASIVENGRTIISNVVFGKLFTNFAAKLAAVAIGAVLYYVVIQVVLWLGLDTNLLKLLSALVVAMFLALPYWKGKLRLKKGGHTHA